MTEDAERLLPFLSRRYALEEDREVRIQVVKTMAGLIRSATWSRYSRFKPQAESIPFFNQIVETETDVPLRAAAAQAAIACLSRFSRHEAQLLSPQVPEALIDYYQTLTDPHASPARHQVIRDLARVGHAAFQGLLDDPASIPSDVHTIGRSLLASAFLDPRDTDAHWVHYPEFEKRKLGQLYQRHPVLTMRGKLLRDQAAALQALVDWEPFWQSPTNLLSFFYGLPDDREALRALLAHLTDTVA
jgi:hypothetical protein